MSRETSMNALATDSSTESLVQEILSEIKSNSSIEPSASGKIAQQNTDLFTRQTNAVNDDPYAPQNDTERKLLEDQTLGLQISPSFTESVAEKNQSSHNNIVHAYVSSTLYDTILQKGYELSQVVFLFAFVCFVVTVYLAPQLTVYTNSTGLSYFIAALLGGIFYAIGASLTNTNATLF